MKFESKKWVLRVALAGALSVGVANVAKADETMAPPVWNVLAQEEAVQIFGTGGGASALNFILQNVRLKGTFGIDANDTVTLQSSFATVGGLTLLDAYDVHTFSDINPGLAAKVGQFRIPFGGNQYLSPDQLIRTNYSIINALIPNGVGSIVSPNASWGLGGELDQTFSDLTFQAAVLQNPNGNNGGATNKDYVGRAQWTGSNLTLGLSDYYSATSVGTANNINTFGANAKLNIDVVQIDWEAIFGRFNSNGYTGTLSAKFDSFQPAVWYEWITTGNSTVLSDDLGAGINFWLGAKTRVALDVDFTGPSSGDILLYNTETMQLQEVF